MFPTKKAKIRAWLQARPQKTAFDELLRDYLEKSLQKKLAAARCDPHAHPDMGILFSRRKVSKL